jgi:hypothetical protein
MIIAHIIGGLGNQMFQYSAGKSLALTLSSQLKLDISDYKNYPLRTFSLDCFNTNCSLAKEEEVVRFKNLLAAPKTGTLSKVAKIYSIITGIKVYKEKGFAFDANYFKIKDNNYITGYFASEKYFKNIEKDIRQEFTLRKHFSDNAQYLQKGILNSNSISIHIRRGDYISNATTKNFHGTCDLSYYKSGITYLKTRISKPAYYIFSDDIAWAKNNLPIKKRVIYVSDTIKYDYEEMMLMSLCRYNIIANSTFSWWGAWLNKYHNKIVIAPKRWFNDASVDTKDLYLSDWLKI